MNVIDWIIIPLQIGVFLYTTKKIMTLVGFLKKGQKSLSLHDYRIPVNELFKATPESVIENKQYADFARFRKRIQSVPAKTDDDGEHKESKEELDKKRERERRMREIEMRAKRVEIIEKTEKEVNKSWD